MNKKFRYILEKIFVSLKIKFILSRSMIYPGILLLGKNKNINEVIFDLSDKNYCHIGDCLFYLPIIELFKYNGIAVKVKTHESVKQLFQSKGYQLIDTINASPESLIITPIWRFNKINKEVKKSTLFIDFTDHRIDQPVSEHMLASISEFYNFSKNNHENHFPNPVFKDNQFDEVDKNKSYYIFNEYVDSGFMRINKSMINKLIDCANHRVKKGYGIIRVGSKNDKYSFDIDLPFESIDLRGKTSLIDLFLLFSKNNIKGSISFDTAIAHIGIIYKKEVYIKMRNFSNKHTSFVKKYIFPFYSSKDNLKISYI